MTRYRLIGGLSVGVFCLLIQIGFVSAQAGNSVTEAGNKFVHKTNGNCYSPLGTYSVQAGGTFSVILVEIKEIVNGAEVAVPAYPTEIQATINGFNWSSPTYTNLPGPVPPALLRTYKVKVRMRGTLPGQMNIVNLATTANQFSY